jgi:hypothetical protein
MFISYHTLIMFYIQEYQLDLQIKIQWGLHCLWNEDGEIFFVGTGEKVPPKEV